MSTTFGTWPDMAVRASALRTWRELWRDGRLTATILLLSVLGIVALFSAHQRSLEAELDRLAAEQVDRETFAGQGDRNPHSVAHFSRFAFRPEPVLAVLDPGLSPYAGSAVWMEAHWQDPASLRPAEDRVELGRFTELSPAWLLQVLLPLMVVALAFDAVAGERERGTWKLVRCAGGSLWGVIAGKALAIGSVFAVGLALVLGVAAMTAGPGNATDLPQRLVLWGLGHALYLAAWLFVSLAVSVHMRSARVALVTLLALWVASALVVPRLATTLADAWSPSPSASEFAQAIRVEIEQGMDGHDPADQRRAQFQARVLEQYGVSRVEDLPVSFAGLAMQESEEYGNKVFDRHFAALSQQYLRQEQWRRGFALASPLLPLQHISMAAAGSDVSHQVDFVAQAEATRRIIVRALNDDMIENGAGKDFSYIADANLWRRIPEFTYRTPTVETLGRRGIDFAILGFWLLLAGSMLIGAVRREGRLA